MVKLSHAWRCGLWSLAVVVGSSCSTGGAAPPAGGPVAIAVTARGFEPRTVKAQVGKPLTMVVTRKVERTCATEIVIKDYGIDQPLPLDQPVKVTFTPTKPGKVRFACGMDMIAGKIAVQ